MKNHIMIKRTLLNHKYCKYQGISALLSLTALGATSLVICL